MKKLEIQELEERLELKSWLGSNNDNQSESGGGCGGNAIVGVVTTNQTSNP